MLVTITLIAPQVRSVTAGRLPQPIVLSQLADAEGLPIGLQATLFTTSLTLERAERLAASRLPQPDRFVGTPDARVFPSGLQAMLLTEF